MKKQQLLRSLSRGEIITNSEDIRTLIQLLRDQPTRFAQLSECAKENLAPYLGQIMGLLLKSNAQISDTVGVIVKNSCIDTESLLTILKPISLNPQCLTRVVQYLPYKLLEQNALGLLRQFVQLLGLQNSRVAVLEGMAAIILSVEEQSFVLADEVIPYLPGLLQDPQWQVKKMAMDILYSLIVLQREKITPQFTEIVQELSQHKIKQVRDSGKLILDILDSQKAQQIQESPVQEQLSVQEKLDLAIDAITQLTQLLKNKGICENSELQPIENLLTQITEPTPRYSFEDTETFISKEAAAILREFKEKQLRQ